MLDGRTCYPRAKIKPVPLECDRLKCKLAWSQEPGPKDVRECTSVPLSVIKDNN